MVVSVMEPKLLMKMLQVTLTGGPEGDRLSSHIIIARECSLHTAPGLVLISKLIQDNHHEIVLSFAVRSYYCGPSVDRRNFKYFIDSFPKKQ